MNSAARTILICALCSSPVAAQKPNVIRDEPLTASTGSEARRMFFAMEPYIAHARATWPDAKRRFVAGLPRRHTLFVTTRLRDASGRIEQVYIAVDSVVAERIHGRIWSKILIVDGYRLQQSYVLSEDDLIDWMIAKPDGSEEGNVVGRFLDTFRP
jgi:hypothetical protein